MSRKDVMTQKPNILTLEIEKKNPLIIMKLKNKSLVNHLSPDQMSYPFIEAKIFSER